MSCFVMHLCALYLLFLPPLLSGRPRNRRWRRWLWIRHRQPSPFSRASRQAKPPWSFLYRPFDLSHACIRFRYYVRLLLFWCIAWFCNLLLILYLLSYMLSIGWLVIHQWPRTLVRVAMLCFRMFDQGDRRAKIDTSPHTPLVVRLCRATIECRGWYLLPHSWWYLYSVASRLWVTEGDSSFTTSDDASVVQLLKCELIESDSS